MEPVNLEERLDPDFMKIVRRMSSELLLFEDIAASRDEMEAARPAAKGVEGVSHIDHVAAGPDGNDIRVRVYRRDDAPPTTPAMYWIHGGGMVMGTVEMNDDYCAQMAGDLGITVASVGYRLAPEHPFPAPLEDCYAGLTWLAAHADDLGIDRGRVAIGGASAGGGLAAGTALAARDRGEVELCFQLLVYPMIDDRQETPSSFMIADPRVWNRHANTYGWDAYLAGRAGTAEVSIYAAPARATDLAGLPPAYINVGDLDLFLDEDVAYAQTMMRAGVPVELHVYPGAFHGSNSMVPWHPESKRWRADEWAAIDAALNR